MGAKDGPASEATIPATTLPALIKQTMVHNANNVALMIERPVPELVDGKAPPALPIEQWTKWTYSEYYNDIVAAAKGFIKLGFKPYDSVIGALASSMAGGKVAGLYPTDTPDTAAFKVVHSGGSVVLVDEPTKIQKLVEGIEARGDLKRLKAFVAWGYEPAANEQVTIKGFGAVPLVSWKALLEMGKAETDTEMESRIAAIKPGNCAALIYTSGTTGDPKAVMISHDNIF